MLTSNRPLPAEVVSSPEVVRRTKSVALFYRSAAFSGYTGTATSSAIVACMAVRSAVFSPGMPV